MEMTALFTTAFVVGLSGAMMPGPLLTATMISSAQRGFKAGPQIVLGHGVLELALIVALLSGAAAFLTKPAVTIMIALIGGLFLLYLGITMISDVWTGKLQSIDPPFDINDPRPVTMYPVLTGFLVSVTNPFWTIWWVTIGLSYLTISIKSGLVGVASFFSGHILADLLWYTLVALAVSKGKRFLAPRVYQGLLISCGIFMLGLSVYFIYTGIIRFPLIGWS